MRGMARLVVAVGLTIGVVPLVVGSTPANAGVTGLGQTNCVSAGTGTTCTGTFGGDLAWNTTTKAQNPASQPPVVTVAQTGDLTYQTVHVTWSNFTPSNGDYYKVGLYECRGAVDASGAVVPTAAPSLSWKDPSIGSSASTKEYQAQGSCYSPDSDANGWSGAANDGVYPTTSNGTGQADFAIQTAFENGWLGCDDKHPCWLAVVPNWGGKQFVSGLNTACATHTSDTSTFGGAFAQSKAIAYPCSWADRIMVPLGFAPTPSECPIKDASFASEGSPLLARAVSQWQPGWCQGAHGLTFGYDGGVDEYQARQSFLGGSGSLTSSLGLAMVSRPPDAAAATASGRKFTYAPLANSAIAIAYYVDNPSTKTPITDLKLNARLMAKLLTQSYALGYGSYGSCGASGAASGTCDPAVLGNPTTIFSDPEFQALNPQYDGVNLNGDDNATVGGFLPLVVAGNSDLTYELTRWVDSDPDAAAFLAGQPDPWGMRVNTNYRGSDYPVDQFQAQDPGLTIPPDPGNPQGSESQTMQSSWYPVAGMANVGGHLVSYRTSGTERNASCTLGDPSVCATAHAGWTYAPLQTEHFGQRALFAVVPESDAAAFAFPTAQLPNAAGQYVAPTTASIGAGVSDYLTNPDKITQYANDGSTDPKAYPLTISSYAMVPTCGLPASQATAISTALTDMAGTGQLYGTAPGDLAPGYLALTKAQKAQTATAANQVGTQSCTSAPLDTTVSGHTGNDVKADGGGTGTAPAGGAGSTAAPSSPPDGGAGPGSSPSAQPSTRNAAFGSASGDSAGWSRVMLPVLLALGGALGLGGPLVYLVGRTGGWAAAWTRIRGGPGALWDWLGLRKS